MLYGAQAVFDAYMAADFCKAINDWIAAEWLARDPRLRASIVVPMQAPDLAIEILSASTRRRDEVTKLRLYDDFGVDEYWIVDPGRESVRVYRRAGKKLALVSEVFDGVFETPLLAGLTISTPVIFEE